MRTISDGAIVAGTPVLTSATAAFTSSDIRSTVAIAGAGASGAPLTATVVKVSSASHVTLSSNATSTANDASTTLAPYLTTTIASVSDGAAILAVAAGSTVSAVNILYGLDAASAIAAAMSAAADAGGGTVSLPPGKYLTTAPISLSKASNISVVGAGAEDSLIYRVGAGGSGVFHTLDTSATSPLTDFTMSDVTIDGAFMQGPYNVHNCGVRAVYLSHCTFRDMTVQNTLATGLGTDYLTNNTTIHNVRAIGCGASSWAVSQGGGCAGIGIGLGGHPVEEFTVSDCYVEGNGTYGIFIENEGWLHPGSSTNSIGARIVNCTSKGNKLAGFADCGGSHTVWMNCQSYDNGVDGFVNSPGTVDGSTPGNDTLWTDCVASGNGEYGFRYSPTPTPNSTCRVTWKNCKATEHNREGFFIDAAADTTLDGLEFDNCESSFNGRSGWCARGPGTVRNVVISGGAYYNNGMASNGDSADNISDDGLRIDCDAAKMGINGVKAYDNSPSQKQAYGLSFAPARTLNDIAVENNDFTGNAKGAVDISATLRDVVTFGNNVGFD
ncbi:glycosyl hydrolase family 28-related protein [Mycolicibacterium moriokaense]|uniref:Parallel beta helix pectate lyase-like protein n=1 Tax=Mycolicibacterium moriokaense TaxID=39691 RepID=A0A318H8A2_9MYCO|nr:glycosyl hydrolase family 28-related protein [Mycolicibacterium moriokaense]PXW99128.1 parallel beta helix pectate lyase-like protein [Mycolicibacterium moriokaense]